MAGTSRWVAVVGQGRGGTSPLYYAAVQSLHDQGHQTFHTYEKYSAAMFDALAAHHRDRWVVAKFLTNHGGFDEALLRRFGRVVQIVRDPRDNLVSVMLFSAAHLARRRRGRASLERWVDLLAAKEADPTSVTLGALVDLVLVDGLGRDLDAVWRKRYHDPIGLADRLGGPVVRLEDLGDGDLAAAEAAVGMPLELAPPPEGKQHVLRSGRTSWARWFLPADVDRFRPVLQPFMDRFGYGADWGLDPAPSIDPEESSRYVIRTFDRIVERQAALASDAPPLDVLRYQADHGSPRAAHALASRLLEEGGDPVEARERSAFAAAAGHREGMQLLARLCREGVGGPSSRRDASYWKRAARR